MDKNTITGFILMAAILFGFTFYQSKQSEKYNAEQQRIADSLELVRKADSIAYAAANPQAVTEPAVQETPAGQQSPVYKDAGLEKAHAGEGSIVTLENDKIVLELSSRGAQPYSVKIKDFYNYDSTALYLFKPGMSEYAISVYAGEYIRTSDFDFQIVRQEKDNAAFRV